MNVNTSAAVAAAGLMLAWRVRLVSRSITRGERVGRVSSEWFSRPDDQRYLSLSALYKAVHARADKAEARTVESRSIRVRRGVMGSGWR